MTSANVKAEQKADRIHYTRQFAKSVEDPDSLEASCPPLGRPIITVVSEIQGSRTTVQKGGRQSKVRTRATIVRNESTNREFVIAGRPDKLSLDQLRRIAPHLYPNARGALASHASRIKRRSTRSINEAGS